MGGTEQAGPKMVATHEEMAEARVPMQWRDYCAHKLIPLNKCRRKNFYLPFRCEDLRHEYEKCQYEQYMLRVGEMTEIVKEQRKADMAAREARELEDMRKSS
eukprot:GFKZ01010624.1.p1 GENE.GFKZ01010624.1~~GFKZ01010624.1.p1  ORF type:complete len:102 (+),score=19.13 GFKZ01010624.1:250-555(+)